MSDVQSTIAGLRAQDCPGGGWNGMPAAMEGRATVADCLADGSCGCIFGDAVQHLERLTAALQAMVDAWDMSSDEGQYRRIWDEARAALEGK